MALDKRIIDRKYIYDCFNADMTKEFIGEDCYMTNDIELFQNLDRINVYKLDRIEDGFYNAGEDEYFDFCLPVRWVKPKEKEKEKEKKYRPYTLQEFLQKIPIGKPIIFRQKGTTKYEKCLIINGYSCEDWSGLPTPYICIGNIMYSLDALFIDYEYKNDYTEDFKPFGVEVKE